MVVLAALALKSMALASMISVAPAHLQTRGVCGTFVMAASVMAPEAPALELNDDAAGVSGTKGRPASVMSLAAPALKLEESGMSDGDAIRMKLCRSRSS